MDMRELNKKSKKLHISPTPGALTLAGSTGSPRAGSYPAVRQGETLTRPTPNPSQEGFFSLQGSFIKFPSWEGLGVGSYQTRFYLHYTLGHRPSGHPVTRNG